MCTDPSIKYSFLTPFPLSLSFLGLIYVQMGPKLADWSPKTRGYTKREGEIDQKMISFGLIC